MFKSLKDLQILVVDCQTTGGNATRNHLIEIGWMPIRASEVAKGASTTPVTHVIQQPEGFELPKYIKRLTGLEDHHFDKAIDQQSAWEMLNDHAMSVATSNRLPLCPAVIHFARFEMTFLGKLHKSQCRPSHFPLDVFCSHQMAARVWPQLPRKGLRAVAGYLGHGVPALKRCGSHLQATASIWRHLVDQLNQAFGVTNLDELRAWIQHPVHAAPVARSFPMPRETRLSVPAGPGIYHLRRSNNDLLYIGKATSLKSRINSYFQSSRHHSESTLEMLTQAVKLDITRTHTALEAALLESDEIKRLHPPYNRALRKDHRTLRFLSKDLKHQAAEPDDHCRLGPVPSPEMFFALHAMVQALEAGHNITDSVDSGQVLCLSDRHAPDKTCFRQGVDLFQTEYGMFLNDRMPWRGLIRIGHRSWLEQRTLKETTPDDTASSEAGATKAHDSEPFEWTAQAVAKTMTSILRRCGFLLRRARWLSILSESTISWQILNQPTGERNILIIQGGGIAHRELSTDDVPLEPPPGGHLPQRDRKANLNMTTYDRLRVLTTELRRLVAEGRPVNIRLNRQASINQSHLRQLFRWI